MKETEKKRAEGNLDEREERHKRKKKTNELRKKKNGEKEIEILQNKYIEIYRKRIKIGILKKYQSKRLN